MTFDLHCFCTSLNKKHPMKTLGNIIWIIFGGLHIALEYFFGGVILMITIIGVPFGKMHFRLAKLALSPFGKELV